MIPSLSWHPKGVVQSAEPDPYYATSPTRPRSITANEYLTFDWEAAEASLKLNIDAYKPLPRLVDHMEQSVAYTSKSLPSSMCVYVCVTYEFNAIQRNTTEGVRQEQN